MAADIINLRRARKAKTREAREQEAAERRRQFGRTKAEKKTETVERTQAMRSVDAHKLNKDP